MPRRITSATSLDTLRKEAKRWLNALRAGSADARARFDRVHPAAPRHPTLRDVQHALAREYGHESWMALKESLVRPPVRGERAPAQRPSADDYARMAGDIVLAFSAADEAALQRLNDRYGSSFSFDDLGALVWGRVYAYRQRAFRGEKKYLLLEEARTMVAQNAGFGSWEALTDATVTGASPVPPYVLDTRENRMAPRRFMSDEEWDELIAVMRERRIAALDVGGQLTDARLARIAELDHVTSLTLGGARQLTGEGLRQLARMPQLQHLNLSQYPGGALADGGLEVLRHLPNLRTFEMTWQRGITDAGVMHLRHCDHLERVDLMGTPTGDGAIEALQGKPNLRVFKSGRLVTDAGLALFRNFPRLQRRQPVEAESGTREDDGAARLLIDGPFTDKGLASLAGLAGVVDLDLFWHVTGITADGFAHLVGLPNLASLGADGRLSDDEAMRHIAAMPRLRSLRAQESVATDAGFEALSRSRTLESFWGRTCPSFGSRAFIAFSKMPALRSLGVSCAKVGDEALATLPHFPALRELTPIGVSDEGFRHVGRCARLERLTCMYCRDTTDAATAHLAALQLKYYYAGLTLITDRSLEMLGRISSLEQVELYECKGVTDAGLPFLAGLPRLREVALDSLPGVTLEGTKVFPARVRVRYST